MTTEQRAAKGIRQLKEANAKLFLGLELLESFDLSIIVSETMRIRAILTMLIYEVEAELRIQKREGRMS